MSASAVPSRPLPRCLVCGAPFRVGAHQARAKVTCTRACRATLFEVAGAPTIYDAWRLLCEKRPNPPRELAATLRDYGAVLRARRLARAALVHLGIAGRERDRGRNRPRRPRPAR